MSVFYLTFLLSEVLIGFVLHCQIMDELNEKEAASSETMEGCNWVPEYGAWMVEATPRRPYTGYTNDLLRVERNMRLRRRRILTVLHENEIAPTVAAFPRLGAMGDDGTVPPTSVGGDRTMSDYIGDGIINPHPRFGTLTANIRQRRGEKVNIRVPLFRDVNTPEYKDLEAPHGGVDGCCGSDSQQVSRSEADVQVYRNELTLTMAIFQSMISFSALAVWEGRHFAGKVRKRLRRCRLLDLVTR